MPKGFRGFQKGHVINVGRKRTVETKQKMSSVVKGKSKSLEHKKALKTAWIKRKLNGEIPFGGFVRRIHTKEERIKRSASLKRAYSEGRKTTWNKGQSKNTNEKLMIASIKKTGRIRPPEEKAKISETMKALWVDPTYRAKRMSNWKNPEFRERMIKQANKNRRKRPTSLEVKMSEIISQLNLPYKYVGDGAVLIGFKNPDFINVNGQKKIIEVFGNYWHAQSDEELRKNHFAKFGFKTLVIWQDEFKDSQTLIEKIKNFEED